MKIVPIPYGSRGIDSASVVEDDTAAALKAAGYTFVVRYIGGISTTEIDRILSAGLGLELVTYSHAVGWMPSATLGVEQGETDVTSLKALGVPEGALIWIDLEGSGGDATDTAAWVNARSKVLVDAGYVAGLYVGDGCVLNAQQLYELPHVTRYWRAFNAGIPTPECGFCQLQLFPPNQTFGSIPIDIDVTQADYRSRVPTMLVGD